MTCFCTTLQRLFGKRALSILLTPYAFMHFNLFLALSLNLCNQIGVSQTDAPFIPNFDKFAGFALVKLFEINWICRYTTAGAFIYAL